jgi:hypothetical protein
VSAVTDLLVNPGFENGTASWGQVSPNASVDTLAANAHSGTASLKLAIGVGLLSDRAGTFWFDDLSLSRP